MTEKKNQNTPEAFTDPLTEAAIASAKLPLIEIVNTPPPDTSVFDNISFSNDSIVPDDLSQDIKIKHSDIILPGSKEMFLSDLKAALAHFQNRELKYTVRIMDAETARELKTALFQLQITYRNTLIIKAEPEAKAVLVSEEGGKAIFKKKGDSSGK